MSPRTLLPRRKVHPNQEVQNIGTVDEPHAEHEIRREEEEERHKEERVFDWSDDVNRRITMRMNQLASLLKTKRIGRPAIEGPDVESDIEEGEEAEAHKFHEELETLLKSFEDDKTGIQKQSEYLSLERPILQLLAQRRSFRICR
jgi:hypothetical protein